MTVCAVSLLVCAGFWTLWSLEILFVLRVEAREVVAACSFLRMVLLNRIVSGLVDETRLHRGDFSVALVIRILLGCGRHFVGGADLLLTWWQLRRIVELGRFVT